jgi:hypothetical protein
MRKVIATLVGGVMLAGCSVAFVGCTDETGTKNETQVTGPQGTTTITDKTTVKKSGDNPPPVPGANNP